MLMAYFVASYVYNKYQRRENKYMKIDCQLMIGNIYSSYANTLWMRFFFSFSGRAQFHRARKDMRSCYCNVMCNKHPCEARERYSFEKNTHGALAARFLPCLLLVSLSLICKWHALLAELSHLLSHIYKYVLKDTYIWFNTLRLVFW